MAGDTELAIVLKELKAVGIRPRVEERGSGHKAVVWQASPDKAERMYVVPNSGSDWRGCLNARADVRRFLRADNVSPPEHRPAPKPILHHALEVPTTHVTVPEQISMLRAEIAELTNLMLAMADEVKALRAVKTPMQRRARRYAR